MLLTAINRARNILAHNAYVPTDYYVFEDKKLVYISIPKVACTSIKIALAGHLVNTRNDYMDIHSLAEDLHQHRLTREQSGYYKFAFVRNPFDRLISCYEDKVRKPVQHTGRYFFDTGYNRTLVQRYCGACFHPEMSFGEFVDLVSRVPDWLSDGHFRSQHSMIYGTATGSVDYIGKFENLAGDWRPVASKFMLPELELRNTSGRRNRTDYFSSEEIITKASQRYMNDITAFGYQEQQDLLFNTLS